MDECIKRDDVRQMLHDLGGCEDNFSALAFDNADITWANGWDKAIEAAIIKLDKLPTVELMEGNKIYLKPCPFCGEKEIISKVSDTGIGKYRFEICCKACDCQITMVRNSKRDYASLDEILEFSKQATDKWNRRYNKKDEAESEVEENA